MSKGTKVAIKKPQINGEDLAVLQEMYQQTFGRWLVASKMTEEELLSFRTVDKFKIVKTTENNVVSISMTYEDKEKNRQTIGEPLIIPNDDNTEAMCDVIFLILFISKKMDAANETEPINGSHVGSYFHERAVKFGKNELKEK